MTTLPPGIVAVIRANEAETARNLAIGIGRSGVSGIEITFTTPSAAEIIASVAGSVDCAVGAGTVRTTNDCAAAIQAGVSFVVSPDFSADVVRMCKEQRVAVVPGALTPGEIGRCIDAGADGVKLFPVGAVGGPSYLTAVSEPFPSGRWVVSGGISIDQVHEYRAAGAFTVCLGGALIDRSAAAAGDIAAITAHARAAMLAVSGQKEWKQ